MGDKLKLLIVVFALFISINGTRVQERNIVRTGHKVTATVTEYDVGTFANEKKYDVPVIQKRGKITRIDWNKRK
jgi:hypothetical protein